MMSRRDGPHEHYGWGRAYGRTAGDMDTAVPAVFYGVTVCTSSMYTAVPPRIESSGFRFQS